MSKLSSRVARLGADSCEAFSVAPSGFERGADAADRGAALLVGGSAAPAAPAGSAAASSAAAAVRVGVPSFKPRPAAIHRAASAGGFGDDESVASGDIDGDSIAGGGAAFGGAGTGGHAGALVGSAVTLSAAPGRRTLRDLIRDDESGIASPKLQALADAHKKALQTAAKRRKAAKGGGAATGKLGGEGADGEYLASADAVGGADGVDAASVAPSAVGSATGSAVSGAAAPAAVVVPQLTLVDGHIIMDTSAMFIPTHTGNARETVYDEHGNVIEQGLETVYEAGDGAYLTSSTHSKRQRGEQWSVDDTRKFFDALRQCGTDFSTIAALFPGRNRLHVKRKFVIESKLHPKLVDAALRLKTPLDMATLTPAVTLRSQQELAADRAKRGEDDDDELEEGEDAFGPLPDAAGTSVEAGDEDGLDIFGGSAASGSDAADGEGADTGSADASDGAAAAGAGGAKPARKRPRTSSTASTGDAAGDAFGAFGSSSSSSADAWDYSSDPLLGGFALGAGADGGSGSAAPTLEIEEEGGDGAAAAPTAPTGKRGGRRKKGADVGAADSGGGDATVSGAKRGASDSAAASGPAGKRARR